MQEEIMQKILPIAPHKLNTNKQVEQKDKNNTYKNIPNGLIGLLQANFALPHISSNCT